MVGRAATDEARDFLTVSLNTTKKFGKQNTLKNRTSGPDDNTNLYNGK